MSLPKREADVATMQSPVPGLVLVVLAHDRGRRLLRALHDAGVPTVGVDDLREAFVLARWLREAGHDASAIVLDHERGPRMVPLACFAQLIAWWGRPLIVATGVSKHRPRATRSLWYVASAQSDTLLDAVRTSLL